MVNAREASLGIFECDTAHDAVHLIPEPEQVFRQVASILSGNTCDQRTFAHVTPRRCAGSGTRRCPIRQSTRAPDAQLGGRRLRTSLHISSICPPMAGGAQRSRIYCGPLSHTKCDEQRVGRREDLTFPSAVAPLLA